MNLITEELLSNNPKTIISYYIKGLEETSKAYVSSYNARSNCYFVDDEVNNNLLILYPWDLYGCYYE